ncbi:MAG: beta-galactosidase [Eubacteriales bacterium]|nr:beta-galactosidase [Eubacteriales bacterium]
MRQNEGLLEISQEGLIFNGKPFYLASGDIHYFRIVPQDWEKRFKLMKAFGLTAIQTYVPWNIHEPRPGVFDFTGMKDLAAFIRLADENDLKVLLRPAPFICSEWEWGGLPAWLLKDRDMEVRCSDPRFLKAVRTYYERLCDVFVPHLSTKGGPIIMVALENEYGGAGYDKEYLRFLGDTLRELGVDVPFYTTDGLVPSMLNIGSLDGIWAGVNYRALPGKAKEAANYCLKRFPDFPFFVGELWGGRQSNVGESFQHRDPEEVVTAYREALQFGYVNFYMFCGGTNFGFMNGARIGQPYGQPTAPVQYRAMTTSYDVDALISEDGIPTEKYYRCRDVLDEYLGKPIRAREVFSHPTQTASIELSETATLFENVDQLAEIKCESPVLRLMEDLDQDYGFILYTTTIRDHPEVQNLPLTIYGLHDRATVYQDGQYKGTVIRDRNCDPIILSIPKTETRIDILVENMGRMNTCIPFKFERKGILDCVRLDFARLYHWTIRTLPMRNLSRLRYRPAAAHDFSSRCPLFMKGSFDAKRGLDTYLDVRGFQHGFAMINGFNLGRYSCTGPQQTLYLPGSLLQDGPNVLEIFDVCPENSPGNVQCIDQHLLEHD